LGCPGDAGRKTHVFLIEQEPREKIVPSGEREVCIHRPGRPTDRAAECWAILGWIYAEHRAQSRDPDCLGYVADNVSDTRVQECPITVGPAMG
jgi:hypothetical protein